MINGTKYKPNYVSPPGETLEELMLEHHLTQADLAERMGRPKKTINEIVQGKTGITPETALQLERVFKTPAQFWLNRESAYRASLAGQAEDARLQNQISVLDDLPIKEMVEYKWIERYSDKVKQLKELLSFFGVSAPDNIRLVEQVAFRKSEAFATNPWALAAWLRKGEIDSGHQRCEAFDKQKFLESLKKARALTKLEPNKFVQPLIQLCNESGVAIAFVRELPRINVSGATRWMSPDRALLQLSLRYKSNDHFWFSFFHESGHIYLEHAKRETLLENGVNGSLDQREIDANDFANNLLIPKAELDVFSRSSIRAETIRTFAKRIGVGPGIVVGRLQHEKSLRFNQCNDLKLSITWSDWPESNS